MAFLSLRENHSWRFRQSLTSGPVKLLAKPGTAPLLDILVARFGPEAEEIEIQLETIADDARWEQLVKLSALCSDLPSFRKELAG